MTSGTSPVTLGEIQAGLESRLDDVRTAISQLIVADFGLIAEVNAHLLRMQGKMFRPTLVLLSRDASEGPDPATAVRLAAVVELIHLATLVHDDAVDHSVLRRGMPTVNALFSHQVSVIMGDYLYSRAVIELVRLDDLVPLQVLARVTNEMTVGEMRQLLAVDPLAFTEEDYNLLIRSKTASLVSGACEVGALGAPAPRRQAMARFGDRLGRAFQIVDDLLDFTSDAAVTGKPVGLDLREHKITLPLSHVLPRLSPAERSVVDELFASPNPSGDQVSKVIEIVTERGGLAYARDRAQDLLEEAEEELVILPPSPARETLRASLTYILERRS